MSRPGAAVVPPGIKPAWRPLLEYLDRLHRQGTYPAEAPLPFPFENPGTGYQGGKCFAHWDTVHVGLDALAAGRPAHAVNQLRNLFALQQPDGFLPGLVYFRPACTWVADSGWPPLWPVLVDACLRAGADRRLLPEAWEVLTRQAAWFERARAATPAGFFYRDIVDRNWESGVDEGIRFDTRPPRGAPTACIDACAHVWGLYDAGARWAGLLRRGAEPWREKRALLGRYINVELYDRRTGFYHDAWTAGAGPRRPGAFEGIWPLALGAADRRRGARVIDEHLLAPGRFNTPHPISTVAAADPAFERRMWRGPAWNSMTWWAATACRRYRRPAAARQLLEAALDDTATHFARTGTIWEFYDPHGGPPEQLARKPDTPHRVPCRDYTGHNPLWAMARLWLECRGEEA